MHDIVSHIIAAVLAAVMHSIHRALRESCQTTVSFSRAANEVYTQTDSTEGSSNAPSGYQYSKRSPYSITERRVPELLPVLGSQPAGDVSHKPGSRQPLLSARPAVTPATLNRAATNSAAW